jgi:hypothetical protein
MTLEELEKRVRALEDVEEIKILHNEYIYALMDWQWDKMLDCFAEDATADIHRQVRRGKKEIGIIFKEEVGKVTKQKGGQILIQPVIHVDGDTATGHWAWYRFFYNFYTEVGWHYKIFGPWEQARYDCEYVRENGKWKFKTLKLTRPWPVQPDLTPK